MPTLGDVVQLLDEWYPPDTADDWDAVGLVCGDPASDVRRILLAVDPVTVVADEALELGAQLVITHHPLFLKGVHGIAANDPKGRIVHRLINAGCGLFAAHTNADSPAGGVSESLALALGLQDLRPLEADPVVPMDKIVVFAPVGAADDLRAALVGAGAGRIGDYDSASFTSTGEGRFRPLEGAHPTIGQVGRTELVEEVRVEAVLPRRLRAAVVEAMKAVHPYEEPAYDVLELAALDAQDRGSGRIGRLSTPISLADFAALVASVLPATAHGVRVAGERNAVIETVGLCGGAGDFLLERAQSAGVDVYLTSDLRHHPASELRERSDAPALVDVSHWAAESTWLPVLERRLLASLGDTVEVRVSHASTDPWTFRV